MSKMKNFEYLRMKTESEQDIEYTIQMTRWLLQPLGLWPLKSKKNPLILRLISIAVCSFLLAFLLVPCCLHMFLVEKDLGVRLKMIGPLSFCLMNIYKYYAVLRKENAIESCILDITFDWCEMTEQHRRNVMLENAKAGRFFTTTCVLFMYGGGLPYSTILPLTREAFLVGNISYRHLAYPSYFIIFNPHIKPFYDLVFLTHCLCGYVMYAVTSGVCSIAIIYIMHICTQCNITNEILKNYTGSFDDKTLENVITKHLRSLKFAGKIEGIFTDVCMVEMMGCTFNICMLGYYFITEYEQSETVGTITFSLLLISFMFNIFIFCYMGELLTEQCENIGEVAYAINWYQLTSKEARNIILILASSQRPVVLTAGKMVTLSIRSFCNVIKASVTYLNMLRTMIANSN